MSQVKAQNAAEPPEAALYAVKTAFRLRNVPKFPSGKLELAALQFDSVREPIVAGMRGSHVIARQLLYKSGTLNIDMRMQPMPGSESIVLIGQLMDSLNPGHGLAGIPVSLLAKGNTVSRKQTNQDGEFNFGLQEDNDVQLVFGIGGERTIVVAVPEAMK